MLPTIVSAIATGSALVAGLLLDARIILDSFTVTYLFIYFLISSHPGGYSTKLYIREAPCRGPIPYSFIYQLCQKRHPFRIPLNDK